MLLYTFDRAMCSFIVFYFHDENLAYLYTMDKRQVNTFLSSMVSISFKNIATSSH